MTMYFIFEYWVYKTRQWYVPMDIFIFLDDKDKIFYYLPYHI